MNLAKKIPFVTVMTVVLAILLLWSPASAQESPQSVETPIGKLDFENGYPSKATISKLYDALDFQRATQAYIWGLPIVSMAEWQIDERTALFYAGTGASKGMMIKMPGVGQAYIMTNTDKDGKWLDGSNTYKLHVPAVVPAKLFWSATAYDNETRCFIENKEDIADRSSLMDMRKNPDGSVDFFHPERPAGI
jgi:hypothetical protein